MFFAAAIFLLLIALLAIPVTLDFRLVWDQAFREDVTLRWAFGLVRIQFPSRQAKVSEPAAEMPEKRALRRRRNRPNMLVIVQQKALRRRLLRLMKDLWRAIQKRNVSLSLRLGLGDPADTGILWSIVGPVAGSLGTLEDVSIIVEPDFFETTFEFDGSGSLRVVPLRVIHLVAALLLSPPVYRGIWQATTASR